jgi:DNA polymerase III subunit gamma/tau
MKQALYRNYRPRSFKEIIGQDHIAKTLAQAVKNGRLSHAYLFTGPRGVGKTSAARILAHAVNGLAYENESQHLDIIEIDAASNRRIDEIRDLREKARTAPTAGKYKIYIIDEVHMLTREAFNALLKTLEEPPAHVIFILATTEAHKLPETIISRTQRFEFKPIAPKYMVKHLKMISDKEKISVTPGALELLSEFGGGSFRDSIMLLDQLSGAGELSEEDIRMNLGIPAANVIEDILSAVNNGDSVAVVGLIQQLKEQGIDPAAAASSLGRALRQDIINSKPAPHSTFLLKQLIEVPASHRPYDYLEICLLEAAGYNSPKDQGLSQKEKAAPTAALTLSAIGKTEPITRKQVTEFDIKQWSQIVDNAMQKAGSIYTALRLAKPFYEDDCLVLKFEYPLHQKKLSQAKNKDILAGLIEDMYGSKLKIDCVVDKSVFTVKTRSPQIPTPRQQASAVGHINNIFGSAEVVEA